ncbi:MAG: hypothetical protein QOG72_498 [Sphingomonadales bacterium]|jgi:MYXO-CTERM domain-containing protein|nr:hypothetical protein [Sphingomonadales bacterium]
MYRSSIRTALASAALLALSAPASAQDDLADKANELAEQANDVQQQAAALSNEAVNAQAARDDDARADAAADGRGAVRDDNDDDDDGGKWGLLGLLGLAGLLGLRKRDDGRVHVDATRDRRP